MNDTQRCPSSLSLERALKNEPDAAREHIDGCARCQAALVEMRATGTAFMRSDDAARLRQQLTAPARRMPWRWVAAPLLVAAAIILYVQQPDDVTTKGEGVLSLERRGAMVQAYWTSAASGHLALFGIEPSGEVSLLFSAEVAPGHALALGDSIGAIGGARVIALFSRRPFALAPILASLRASGRVPADFAGQVTTLALPEEPR